MVRSWSSMSHFQLLPCYTVSQQGTIEAAATQVSLMLSLASFTQGCHTAKTAAVLPVCHNSRLALVTQPHSTPGLAVGTPSPLSQHTTYNYRPFDMQLQSSQNLQQHKHQAGTSNNPQVAASTRCGTPQHPAKLVSGTRWRQPTRHAAAYQPHTDASMTHHDSSLSPWW
jgi:hypothetical protein